MKSSTFRIPLPVVAIALAAFVLTALALHSQPGDNPVPDRGPTPRGWPMFGGSPSRNMVNLIEQKLPTDWSIEDGKRSNIKWVAELGDRTYGSPVVANGVVYIGSNGKRLGDRRDGKSVLYAFREIDGTLLWRNDHDDPPEGHPLHKKIVGLFSTPTIDANRIYYVTPLSEVICADSATGKIAWRYDMVKELKIEQNEFFICPAFQFYSNLCSPLVVGDFIYVATGNRVNDDGKVTAPDAPSFVALNKKTGKLAWSSNLPGDKIIEGHWSNPTYANVKGVPQVIFAGGDGVIYSFEPDTGKLIWKCDCLPQRRLPKDDVKDYYFVGTPVVVNDRLYVGLGTYPEKGRPRNMPSYFLCLNVALRGDVSLKSYDQNAKANKDSALVWAFGGAIEPPPQRGPSINFHCTASTAAVHDGLVYIADEDGYLYCLDAATGGLQWRYDVQANVWGSPYIVDNRVFLGTDDGSIHILGHSRAARHIAANDMDEQITTTPVAANGVLYVATRSKLYAIGTR